MKSSIRISEAEWHIMNIVWARAPIAATAILEASASKKNWTLTTVRTLLRRLVNKGALAQRLEGKRYLYTPRVSMEECIRQEGNSLLDRLLGRSASPVILHLVEKAELSKEDIKELRRILREKEQAQ